MKGALSSYAVIPIKPIQQREVAYHPGTTGSQAGSLAVQGK